MQKKCQYPGCITLLSRYNCAPCCFLHHRAWLDILEDKIDRYEHEIRDHQRMIQSAGRVAMRKNKILVLKQRVKNLKARRKRQYMQVVTDDPRPEAGI